MSKWKSEWGSKGTIPEGMPQNVFVRMMTLRRQLLLHAYIYYTLNHNLISDHEWDRRGREHLALQKEWGWNIGFYDVIFRKYNGQSAYWFPTNKLGFDENVDKVARKLIETDEHIATYPDAVKTETGHTSQKYLKELLAKAAA